LDWKDIDVYLTTLKTSMSNQEYIAALDLAYGNILNGRVRDSDYALSHRRGEFARAYARNSGDYTFDAMARIGRIFEFADKATITPSLGYGAFWQNLRVKNGHGKIGYKGDNLKKLNSTYQARWYAPFVHLGFSSPLTQSTIFDVGYALFYPVRYRAHLHWNLRNKRNTDQSNEWKNIGHRANLGLRFACTDRLELGLGCALSRFETHGGTSSFRNRNKKNKRDRGSGRIPFRKSERTFADYLLTLSYSF